MTVESTQPPRYKPSTYEMVFNDTHTRRSRRADEFPEEYEGLAKVASAAIDLINSQTKNGPIPKEITVDDKVIPIRWEAWRWFHDEEKRWRWNFSIQVDDLKLLTGNQDLPNSDQVSDPTAEEGSDYLTIGFNEDNKNPRDFEAQTCTRKNFVTTFLSLQLNSKERGISWTEILANKSVTQGILDVFAKREKEQQSA